MPKHQELDRFTASGKTFFFNKGRARNDTDYLAINTIYGQGSQERITLFPSQMLEFYKYYLNALEDLTGLRPGNSEIPEPEVPKIPANCPDCGDTDAAYAVEVREHAWQVVCSNCRELIFHSTEDTNG